MARPIAAGVERGELRPDVPVEFARELGQGVPWHRFPITGDPIDDEVVVRIVDEIVRPFVRPLSGRTRASSIRCRAVPTGRGSLVPCTVSSGVRYWSRARPSSPRPGRGS